MPATILIVDDDNDIADHALAALSGAYEMLKARNSDRARRVIREKQVDLVICDVLQPTFAGYELCQLIKSDMQTSHIPVILLAADNSPDTQISALEARADVCLEKTGDPGLLTAQISNLLWNRNKVKQYYGAYQYIEPNGALQGADDESFLHNLSLFIKSRLHEADLDITHLTSFANMSRTTLYRKVKKSTGLSPHELITATRLKVAADLLNAGKHKIFEIADMVGFSSQHHFSRSFSRYFHRSPRQYIKHQKATRVSL